MKDQATTKPERKPSTKFMTLAQVAAHYCTSETSVRLGRSEFAQLGKCKLGRRTLVLRSSVEELDRQLERQAKAPHDALRRIFDRGKRA